MGDARRPLLAGCLAVFALTASAQQCVIVEDGQPFVVRSQGVTELIGDILIRCTGGVPTPAGQSVPQTDITARFNVNVGGLLGLGSASPGLLLIDDPPPANQNPCLTANGCPVNGVGGSGVNFGNPGAPGNQGQEVANVFQGRQAGSNSVVWLGVPFDPPGTVATRIIRITNVRATLPGEDPDIQEVLVTLSSSAGRLPVENPEARVAVIQGGLADFSIRHRQTGAGGAQSLVQCESVNPGLSASSSAMTLENAEQSFQLRFEEGFPNAFRLRSSAMGASGTPFPSPGAQDLPGFRYGSETGFFNPLFPAGFGGVNQGLPLYGTRLIANFTGIPAGVRLFAGVEVGSRSSSSIQARMIRSGSGAAMPVALGNGVAEVPVSQGGASIYLEVIRSDPERIETLFLPVAFSYTANPAANMPGLGIIGVFGGLSPTLALAPNRVISTSSDLPVFGADPDILRATQRLALAARINACQPAGTSEQLQLARPPQFNPSVFQSGGQVLGTNIFLSSTHRSRPVNLTALAGLPPPSIREVTADWLTVESREERTPMTVSVRADPTGLAPGTYFGAIRFDSPGPPDLVNQLPVQLEVLPPGPRFVPRGVTGAADYFAGAVSPGQAIVVFGAGLGPAGLVELELDAQSRVASILAGTRVLFDGIPSPMIYTRSDQISAFVPFGIAGRTVTEMRVEYQGVRSPALMLPVLPALPGLFTLDQTGFGQAAALNQDNTVNGPANPANPGDVIVLFGSGAGQTNPPGVDGQLAGVPLPQLTLPVTVRIDGQAAQVEYAGPAPTLAEGVLQVNARIPAGRPRRGGAGHGGRLPRPAQRHHRPPLGASSHLTRSYRFLSPFSGDHVK